MNTPIHGYHWKIPIAGAVQILKKKVFHFLSVLNKLKVHIMAFKVEF
jgi:hypothetical protein